MRRAWTIVVVATAACALTGCGAKTIHPRTVEREIAKGYQQQVAGSKVKSVACPDQIANRVGTKVTCTLALESGASGAVSVTVIDDDGHVRWKVATPGT